MLIEFTVGNFRSFREDVTLNLAATSLKSRNGHLAENVVELGRGLRVLRTAAIYGANASGKSNLAKAIRVAKKLAKDSARAGQQGDSLPMEPFLLNAESAEEPSYFEFVLQEQTGSRFRYGFEADESKVYREWAFELPAGKQSERRLFEREGQEVKLGSAFKEGKDMAARTRSNALFLSVCAQWNGQVSGRILSALESVKVISGLNDGNMMPFTLMALQDAPRAEAILNILRGFDLGFEDIQVRRWTGSEPDAKDLPDAYKQLLDDYDVLDAKTVHPLFNEEGQRAGRTTLSLGDHESEGTQRLVALAGPMLDVLRNGYTLVVDEFDARLHPLISRRLLSLFHDPTLNPLGAQLIVLTHDSNLLDRRLLRRDQVWFTEKHPHGYSTLYSLAEVREDGKLVRNDANYESDYIEGRYGGIPLLRPISLTWADEPPAEKVS